MKSGFAILNSVRFMKRLLLSSLLLIGMGGAAFGYVNNSVLQSPPMDIALVQQATVGPVFVNKGLFQVDLSRIQNPFGATIPFETSDTLYFTNSGTLIGIPGFDFENFPSSVGQAHMASIFVNTNAGIGSGIYITNTLGGGNPYLNGNTVPGGGVYIVNLPINWDLSGLATFKVRATNIIDSGLVTMDNTGLIDLAGENLDLNRSRFTMTSSSAGFANGGGITTLDDAWGVFGTNTLGRWFPAVDLTPNTATTPFFTGLFDANTLEAEMTLTNAITYFENLSPTTNASGVIIWRGIYLQDNSPANVTKNVWFGDSVIGDGAFNIEWVGTYRDPSTGQINTNYFYMSDDPVARRDTNNLPFRDPPDFFFQESNTRLIPDDTVFAVPGYVNPAPQNAVSNDFSYVSVRPSAALVDTNVTVGQSPTNLPGRVQLLASRTLNLANARITGPNYVSLISTNHFQGNSNALIVAPYSTMHLGVTNGSLTLSNLMLPELPTWTGVPGAPSAVTELRISGATIGFQPAEMGGVQAWSGSYLFVDDNGITNDVRILLVNSALKPTTPALQQDVTLHAPNNLILADELNIFRNFFSDTTTLTIGTNDNSAFSLNGALNLLSSDIFWSASLPNLQYLTNFGKISSQNLMAFAGNINSPFDDFDAAIPYQAFVNDGVIANQGIFIKANYFENNGTIQESFANNIDVNVTGNAISTNGSFLAPFGHVAISANNLLASNGVIQAGQNLTLTTPCYLSDGYVFGNEFGHITNSVLPNVVTNGNIWSVGGGVRIMGQPASGDLLGTTITNSAANGVDAVTVWPGNDLGVSPDGFANNLALGRMVLNVDTNGGMITFMSLNGSNALYVDSLEFQGSATNTDANGNPASIAIQSGMTIYYAQALQNGVSVAEKINGKFGAAGGNGGRFLWVSNYAGVYSSTNMQYPDGNTYIFNQALAVSPDIDSDGDGTVNRDDPTPIPTGITFDIINNGPVPCGGGITNNPNPDPGTNAPLVRVPGALSFPQEQAAGGGSDSGSVSFTLAQGSYNGLFYDTNGVTPSSSGFFTAKVTAKGGMTAKLTLGSHTYSFAKPVFDGTGHYSGTATSKGLPSLTVDLQLVNNDEIQGQVTGDGWTAQLVADLAGFGSKNKAPWVGNNTVLLQTDPTNSTAAAGGAFGAANISKSGAVQWSGTLPDGTKVSQKSALSKDGLWPLYSSLYGGAGSLIGWMQCTNSELGGSAVWIVPAGVKALYPNGLTNGLVVVGSQTTGTAGALSHSTAIISGSSISSITNHVTIIGKTGQSSDGTLQLSVNLKTGFFTGSVVDTNTSQKFSVQGALLEKSGIGGGFFLNSSQDQGGKIYLAPAN